MMRALLLLALFSFTFGDPRGKAKGKKPQPEAPPPCNVTYDFEISALEFSTKLARALLSLDGIEENTIYSPISLLSVLNLLMAGASGRTYDEIRYVLRYPVYLDDYYIDCNYYALLEMLLEPNRGVNITIANRIFFDERVNMLGPFITKAIANYRSGVESIDFKASLMARNRINRWVNETTKGIIPALIQSPLSTNTQLVVTNAVYFKGQWELPFTPSLTIVAPFVVSPSETLDVHMMVNVQEVPIAVYNRFGIRCTILGLPYTTKNFGLFFILPKKEGLDGLREIEERLESHHIIDMIYQMQFELTSLRIPRLKASMHKSMRPFLEVLGLYELFDSSVADFTRISRGNIMINDAVHKAEIEVNEEGTVAGAATAATLTKILPKKQFWLNRPFIMFLRDNFTGMPLFWARIVRPNQ